MCIFSGAVERVSNTRIFARTIGRGPAYQVIVYQMKMSADEPMAMILPIPIHRGTREGDVKFINLKAHADFFERMEELFPKLQTKGLMRGGARNMSFGADSILEVHEVGDYEASFVPTIADFSRLDTRFRLPENTWDKIPAYADYGFAVFKLNQEVQTAAVAASGFQMPQPIGVTNPARRGMVRRTGPVHRGDNKEFHPMAFSFPTRIENGVFFPTVHIHDGQVHKTENFDHTLYMQAHTKDLAVALTTAEGWEISGEQPGHRVGPPEVVDYGSFVYKATMNGELTNIDTIIKV